ncbi:MAG TPA: TlpA disulfide reductase family protein [Solirubrobacteraceae bacterium]|nr:TlpA disulfide reductase family protein [Solirubrobacteraceae bacterium]
MTSKRLLIALSGLMLVALLGVGVAQLVSQSPARTDRTARTPPLTRAQMQARLTGSPPVLAALHAQANQLLGGGERALRARLAELRGRPVVINKWASWCGPCRSEFGAFQRAAVEQGREVAFIGIDSGEPNRGGARAFLSAFPVSYPSYYDHSGSLGTKLTDTSFMPATVFYDRAGRQYIHQGPYRSLAKLSQDVERYALGA